MALSLVTIVKDEEANLPAMIRSALPVVDEFIIVDTGSTDSTVEVASAVCWPGMGTILEFGPSNNFSEPRNLGLSKATGDWILHLDADDRLLPWGRTTIDILLRRDPDVDGFCLGIEEKCERPYVAPAPRLFRHKPDIRYQGRVHMIPKRQEGDLRWALVTDGPHIQHIGYETPDIRRSKLERNIRLLMLDLEDNPNDYDAMYYLATHHKDLLHEDQADYWARRALTANTQPPWVIETLRSCLKGNKLKVKWYE